jgi:hypothetical protein
LTYFVLLIVAAGLLSAFWAGQAHATGNKDVPPKVVIVEDHDDNALVGALIGAGITYWIMHRRHKKNTPVIPPTPVCETKVVTERIFEACVAK